QQRKVRTELQLCPKGAGRGPTHSPRFHRPSASSPNIPTSPKPSPAPPAFRATECRPSPAPQKPTRPKTPTSPSSPLPPKPPSAPTASTQSSAFSITPPGSSPTPNLSPTRISHPPWIDSARLRHQPPTARSTFQRHFPGSPLLRTAEE